MEVLERIHLLADADQLDRLAGGGAHGKGGTAAAVTVDAGHDDAGDIETLVEGAGDVDGVLAGQRIDDEQDFVRPGDRLDLGRLGHELFVDMGAASGVEDEDIVATEATLALGAAGNLDRGFGGDDRQGVDADLLAQHAQLLHGGRAASVERGQQNLLLLAVLEALGDLGGGGGLARALEADHQQGNRSRRVEVDGDGVGAEHRNQFVMDDLDDLLARSDRTGDLGADGALAHLLDKGTDHFEGNVGLDQRPADFAHGGVDVRRAQRAAATKPIEDLAKPV